MATTFITTDTFSPIFSSTFDADYYVARGVLVGASSGYAFFLSSSNHDLWVNGDVAGASYGIYLGDSESGDFGNSVTVAAGATVAATSTGVQFLSNSSRLTNDGSIQGGSTGVYLGGIGSGQSSIVNRGAIASDVFAIAVNEATTETVTLLNTGSVVGGGYAYLSNGGDNVDLVTNRGLMAGRVDLDAGDDVLDNRGGEVLGLVDLRTGDDSVDNRGGSITGLISGGDGADTLLPGAGEETFDGGAGIDTLDFRTSGGLRVSLRDDSGTGVAAGDSYLNVERVYGSRGGADALIGSDGNNTLFGYGGADTLTGNGGADILVGGIEADRLTGGAGDDGFQFTAPGDGGDLILDFGGVAGDDAIRIRVAGFGGGLVAGGTLVAARFQSRADNVAQDPDDRFVFRTTDRTLWWDPDGSGAAGPVLLADLQAGATLTANDILLI